MKNLPRTVAGSVTAIVASLGVATAPAHAESPVHPLTHDIFVISPPLGACSFPVQWDFTSRGQFLEIDRPPSLLLMGPGSHLTLTNVDTGKTWTPHGNGTVTWQDQDDGSILQTLSGVTYTPLLDQQLIGTFTRYLDPDTNTFSDWVGGGTINDICAKLS